MKLKIDRVTPLIEQLKAVFALIGDGLSKYTIVEMDKYSAKIAKIDTDNIVFSLYLDIEGPISGIDRLAYFRRRTKKYTRLDAGIALALLKNINIFKDSLGKDENNDKVTIVNFDGTILRDEHGNDWVVSLFYSDGGPDESCLQLSALSDESCVPSAVLINGSRPTR